MIFNYYPSDIKSTKPLGAITLDRFVEVIKNPKQETKDLFIQLKEAHENKDLALKQQLKSKLYYFTPCVFVKEARKYDNIINFTGLLALDFDKLETERCKEFKHYLFHLHHFVVAAWISPSQHGVRALVSIPVCNSVYEFKTYYNAIEKEFGDYNGFDKATKNCILPMFLSYDEKILYRENYTTWNKQLIIVEQPIVKQYIIKDKTNLIEAITKSAIDKITGNGHPQLRAIAFAVGGYIAAGYIDSYDAKIILHNLIDSNEYLNKKPSVYKQTAEQMIIKGQAKPLYLQEK